MRENLVYCLSSATTLLLPLEHSEYVLYNSQYRSAPVPGTRSLVGPTSRKSVYRKHSVPSTGGYSVQVPGMIDVSNSFCILYEWYSRLYIYEYE